MAGSGCGAQAQQRELLTVGPTGRWGWWPRASPHPLGTSHSPNGQEMGLTDETGSGIMAGRLMGWAV